MPEPPAARHASARRARAKRHGWRGASNEDCRGGEPLRIATMELAGKHVIVTGGASGIGAAMCERFAAEGARGVVVADRDADGAVRVAERIGDQALAASTDVGVEADVRELVERATNAF